MLAHYRFLFLGLISFTLCLSVAAPTQAQWSSYPKLTDKDWPWWRGPNLDGSANLTKEVPLPWDSEKDVKWMIEVPGRGHGSPTIAGDSIYLATCDESNGSQSVLAFDRQTGQRKWAAVVHEKGAMLKNAKSSGASSSVATDGERLYINFATEGKVILSALSLEGRILWQEPVCDYQIHQGYGASPALYENLIYSVADTKGGGAIAAFERATGKLVWKQPRPSNPNYPSPIVLTVAGKPQLILTGCDKTISYHPKTGEVLWEVAGATTECVTTTVTDGLHVYSSGGYPKNHMSAIRGDGSQTIAWENDERVYVPSMVIKDGYLYAVLDAGIAACWKADTGKQMWKGRLGSDISASLILVGNKIYAINEKSEGFVFEATPKELKLLGKCSIGDEMFASPIIADGCIYLRVAFYDGPNRSERLICIGR